MADITKINEVYFGNMSGLMKTTVANVSKVVRVFIPPGSIQIDITNNDDDTIAPEYSFDNIEWTATPLVTGDGGTTSVTIDDKEVGEYTIYFKWYDPDTEITYTAGPTTKDVLSDQTTIWSLIITDHRPQFVVATGGTITYNGNNRIHTFTNSSTFTVTNGGDIQVECWGAGGNGAQGDAFSRYGGGGGGGGYARAGKTVGVTGYAITAGVGSNSVFGSNLVYATKGGNGTSPVGSIWGWGGAGGAGYGTGAVKYTGGGNASLHIYAGSSSAGTNSNGNTAAVSAWQGAAAVTGGGAGGNNGFYYNANGSPGGFPGGGGGGTGSSYKTAGGGAGGKVVITYQYQ